MSVELPKITPICLSTSHAPDLGTSLHAYVWRSEEERIIAKSSIYLEIDEARLMPGADPLHPPQVRTARAVTFVYTEHGRVQIISDFLQEDPLFGKSPSYSPPDGPNINGDRYALRPLQNALIRLGFDILGAICQDGAPECYTINESAGRVCSAVGKCPSHTCPQRNAQRAKRVYDEIPIEDGPTEPWCVNHQATTENPAGTDCIAHMGDGRVFKCPYKNLAAAKCAEFPCSDAAPKTPEGTKS